jgi:hypothetical protein
MIRFIFLMGLRVYSYIDPIVLEIFSERVKIDDELENICQVIGIRTDVVKIKEFVSHIIVAAPKNQTLELLQQFCLIRDFPR